MEKTSRVVDPKKEKRKYLREDCLISVDYVAQDRGYRDFITNISEGGVHIETTNLLEAGLSLTLSFAHPATQKQIKLAGEVVRSNAVGMGVKYKVNDDNPLFQLPL